MQASNADHRRTVSDMGITMISVGDGKVQLMHSFYNVSQLHICLQRMKITQEIIQFYQFYQAKSPEDAEKGLLFMKEIVELSKSQLSTSVAELQAVFFKKPTGSMEILMAGPSHFSKELTGTESIQRPAVFAEPFRLCTKIKTPINQIDGKIVIVERGDCTFVDKARKAQAAGAAAVIVTDNVPGTAANDQPMFAMSGDGNDDVTIPVVFLFTDEAKIMKTAIESNPELDVSTLSLIPTNHQMDFYLILFSFFHFTLPDKHHANGRSENEIGECTKTGRITNRRRYKK